MSKALTNLVVEEVTITGDDHRPINRRRIALFKGEIMADDTKKIEIPDSLAAIVEHLADSTKDLAAAVVEKACGAKVTEKAKSAISAAMKMLDSVKAEMDPEMWDRIEEAMGVKRSVKSEEEIGLEAFAKSAGLELTDATRPGITLAHTIHAAKAQADNQRIKVLEEQVQKAEEGRRTEEIRKSVVAFEKAVPASQDDLVEILKALPVATAKKFTDFLTRAAEGIKKGALATIGSDAPSDGNAPSAVLRGKTEALRKAEPKLSYEDAEYTVLKANPDLYEQVEAERKASK